MKIAINIYLMQIYRSKIKSNYLNTVTAIESITLHQLIFTDTLLLNWPLCILMLLISLSDSLS